MKTKAQLSDYALLVSFAAPKATRTVAKKYGVPTGAIALLNAVNYRYTMGKSTSSAQLQAPETATKPLVRANIAALLRADLLQRQSGRSPWLRLTSAGIAAGFLFQRELREILYRMERG